MATVSPSIYEHLIWLYAPVRNDDGWARTPSSGVSISLVRFTSNSCKVQQNGIRRGIHHGSISM
jgi:hypothetical protein